VLKGNLNRGCKHEPNGSLPEKGFLVKL
jgi:hypothetical protein